MHVPATQRWQMHLHWQHLLQHMPSYPSTTLRFIEVSAGAKAGLNDAPGLFTEALWGHTPGMSAEWFNINMTSPTVPVVWPFCNAVRDSRLHACISAVASNKKKCRRQPNVKRWLAAVRTS